ncbi:hypothetical protein ACFWU5_25940 [Nocardia sp. NPDC058640]|uniref:hypothetical protein n=1 Tax=Nocardia sp. NPDC058640 TaxID=3346571 RepID=UPI00366463ED
MMKNCLITAAAIGGVLVLPVAYSTLGQVPTAREHSVALMQDSEDLGTREKPVPLGETFDVGEDWQVSVISVDTNATDDVLAENQFNDPPASGRQFVIIRTAAKYVGEETGLPWIDLDYQFYGSKGNTYDTGDSCGVIPDSLNDVDELYPDAGDEGNVCFSVPADQIDKGAVIVEESWTMNDSKTFFAIK